jgi:phosphoglycerate dehydrogenase-like enzyme
MNKDDITIHFAHSAYQFSTMLDKRDTGINHFQTWTPDETRARIAEGDVLISTGFWRNDLLPLADNLKFIQVCGAGYDQFDQNAIRAQGVRLANASGVNVNAVSDHAMALTLSLTRQLASARDNQRDHHWRGMISDLSKREDELAGKTMVIYGLGKIGGRVARLAKAFEMNVIGLKRDVSTPVEHVDELHPSAAFTEVLPRADVTVLCCPLTDVTRNVVNAGTFLAMKPSSYLVNVARGGCVEESALINALQRGAIAGAGIDVTVEEPLAKDSPLWDLDNAIVTPHTGGETRKYEDNVLDILLDNLERLFRGETELHNQVV